MKKIVTVKVCGAMPLSDKELRAIQENRKMEYEQSLNELCPSSGLRKLAERLSAQEDSCEYCAFCESSACNNPYSVYQMDYLNIDPCYEGVLRYLVGEAETAKEENGITPEEIDELLDLMERSQERELRYIELIRVLTGIAIGLREENYEVPADIFEMICELHSSTNDMIEQIRGSFEENNEETE